MSDLQDHYRTLLTKKDAEITADTQNKKQGKRDLPKTQKPKRSRGRNYRRSLVLSKNSRMILY